MRRSQQDRRRAFTLLELLVVITIIIIVSVVTLPTVIPAISHRQASEAARILQGALVGARDAAMHGNQPSGIRLLPDPVLLVRITDPASPRFGQIDPTAILAYNRVVPIAPAPDYANGKVSVYPGTVYAQAVTGGVPALVLESSPGTWKLTAGRWVYLPNEPPSWNWNIRVGDKIRIGPAEVPYTVVGPVYTGLQGGNAERFVNSDPAARLSRTVTAPDGVTQATVAPEYLLLVNGTDDNGNGLADEGFDGIDENNNGVTDEALEWETERWLSALATGRENMDYLISRRPVPQLRGRETALPTDVVVDATTWGLTRERSRLPVDSWTGYVDVLLNPDGTVVPTTLYSTPASFGLDGAFFHFWLAERGDVAAPSGNAAPLLPMPKGEYRLVTLFTRTGQITVNDNPNPINPFTSAQQGGQ
jgi:type II secretory pathway pseudopilin PulG